MAPAPSAVGVKAATEKLAASGENSLLSETGWLFASSRVLLFISLVFNFSVPIFVFVNVFAFIEASTPNVSFSLKKKPK